MKLIDILKITDPLSHIVIWDKEPVKEGTDPLFDGLIDDVPWSMAVCPLYPCLEDGECAISIRRLENGDGVMVVGIDYYDYIGTYKQTYFEEEK